MKFISKTSLNKYRVTTALSLSVLALSACSGSGSDDVLNTDIETVNVPNVNVPANDGSNLVSNTDSVVNEAGGVDSANATVTTTPVAQAPTTQVTTTQTPTTEEVSVATDQPLIGPLPSVLTQVEFDITVPVYVSDSLQVQISWGDTELSAAWVVDETWIVSGELPSDTENVLTVNFVDQNGAVVLGSYETDFNTGTSPMQTVQVFADQFDVNQWDTDGDGISNLDEAIAGTNPLAAAAPATENLIRVDFGMTVLPYMSDELQVRFDWGDEQIDATWAGDESWAAFADLPANTEEPLTITFADRSGELIIGTYETMFNTGESPGYHQFEAHQLNTFLYDDDTDGVNNYRELVAETDPLVSDSTVPVTFASVESSIRARNCSGCHSQWRVEDLYEQLIDETARNEQSMIVPFEPDESFLVEKLEGSMLNRGGVALAGLVRAWIELGALPDQ